MDNNKVITPDFSKRAATRIAATHTPKSPPKSPIIQEIAEAFLPHRSAKDYRSTIDGMPHRFVIIYNIDGGKFPGIAAQASPNMIRSEKAIENITSARDSQIVAVLRLAQDFESQWPRDRMGDTLEQLIAAPVDLRHQDAADVAVPFRPPAAE